MPRRTAPLAGRRHRARRDRLDPYQQLLRNVGFSEAPNLWKHKADTLRALETVAQTSVSYVHALKTLGVDAYFLSINGAIREGFPRGSTREVYETYQRPFELEMLRAAEAWCASCTCTASGSSSGACSTIRAR